MKEKKIITIYQRYFQFYKQYHKNDGNVFVHTICIPVLVWSLFGLMNNLGYFVGLQQSSNYKFIPSILIYVSYMIYYYIIAPRKLFWKTVLFYLFVLTNSNSNYKKKSPFYYLMIHILSWVFQILSHKFLEGNRPALLNGVVQSFLTAPIFVVYELDQILNN
tara:strand:- start:990 stop:1475 length:486 start_codon:yes stop_codon:yes gene_type:complete